MKITINKISAPSCFYLLRCVAALLSGAFFRPFSPTTQPLPPLIFPRLLLHPSYIFSPSVGDRGRLTSTSFSPILSGLSLHFCSLSPHSFFSALPSAFSFSPEAAAATVASGANGKNHRRAATLDRPSPSPYAGGSRRRTRLGDGRSRHRRRYRRR